MKKNELIKKFRKVLKEDEDLYFTWRSNIAMAFYDECRRNKKKHKNREDIHEIANNAAINFLNSLINDVE